MATRKTTKKATTQWNARKPTKAQLADKWYQENKHRWAAPVMSAADANVLCEVATQKFLQSKRSVEHRFQDGVRRALQLVAADYDGQMIRQEAAATGEPLVTGLPNEFAGLLTETFGGCWKWHGEHRPGRGIFSPRPIYKGAYVYRLLFVALRGPVEPGKQLHHRCYRGWCANPWHTEPLTHDEHLEKHTPSIAWLRAAGMSF